MKQNERILVYLVTGFLAVILLAAVFFGQDGKAAGRDSRNGPGAQSMADLMGEKGSPEGARAPDAGGQPGVAVPATGGAQPGGGNAVPADASGPRSPLVAQQPGSQQQGATAGMLAQFLGASARDRDWRLVTAREGDSLEALVRRWCGARDPYLEDTLKLNEGLRVLRPGDPVTLPWVDDEKVYAAYQARQPRLLSGGGSDAVLPVTAGAVAPAAVPAPDAALTFRVPGAGGGATTGAETSPAAGAQVYTVKDKDSLWKIAAGVRGKGQADKVLGEIRRLNPGLSDRLQPGQKITIPAQ